MKEIRYIHGINNAIAEEMERDENVVFIGEDLGVSGGAFGAARGLLDKFGARRIIDTPISEASFVGLAAGAAAGAAPTTLPFTSLILSIHSLQRLLMYNSSSIRFSRVK